MASDDITVLILRELRDGIHGLRDETRTRFDKIDERLDGIDERLDGIDERLDGIDERIDGIDDRLEIDQPPPVSRCRRSCRCASTSGLRCRGEALSISSRRSSILPRVDLVGACMQPRSAQVIEHVTELAQDQHGGCTRDVVASDDITVLILRELRDGIHGLRDETRTRFDKIDERLDGIDERLDGIGIERPRRDLPTRSTGSTSASTGSTAASTPATAVSIDWTTASTGSRSRSAPAFRACSTSSGRPTGPSTVA